MAADSMNRVIQCLRSAALRQNGAEPSDGQLLEWFIERRDEVAFEILLRRHGSMVLGVCRRVLHNSHDVEDAFQATFAVLVRKAASVLPRQMVGNWLYGVAFQTATRAKAHAAKRRMKERQAAMPETKGAPDDFWHDLLPLLDQELSQLPAKYRFPIVLCDLEGKTYKEAARQLDCPEGTFSARLARARSMLAKRLTRGGAMISGTALSSLLSSKVTSACVPPSLVAATLKVTGFAAGKTATTGAISAKVATLAEGVLKTMLLTKLKIATAILLAVALTVTTAGLGFQSQISGTGVEPSKSSAAQTRKRHEKTTYFVRIPSLLDGVLLFIGTEIKEGETVSADRLITVQIDGKKKQFRRLRKGDPIKDGQLVARLDDRLTRAGLGLEMKRAKLNAAENDSKGADAIAAEANNKFKQAEEQFAGRFGKTISVEDYRNAELTKNKMRFDANSKKAAATLAEIEVRQAQEMMQLNDIRTRVNGVIAALRRYPGEAVNKWDTVLEIEVMVESPAEIEEEGTPKSTKGAAKSTHLVRVPSLTDGVIACIATEIKEGEKVPADRLITVQIDGQKKQLRRLRKGDPIKDGQLMARLDDRLMRTGLGLEMKRAKLTAAENDSKGADAIAAEANNKFKQAEEAFSGRFGRTISVEEYRNAELTKNKMQLDASSKKEVATLAEMGVRQAQEMMQLNGVRSRVNGVITAILKHPGEAVRKFETVLGIEVTDPDR